MRRLREQDADSEAWPAPPCERLPGEGDAAYCLRSGMIATIVEGFRMGRYRGCLAEQMEQRLILLQDEGLGAVPPSSASQQYSEPSSQLA